MFAEKILRHKTIVFTVFLVVAGLCAVLTPWVKVNYHIADYLPAEAPSTVSLQVLLEEFAEAAPNTRILIKDVSIPEALLYKEQFTVVPGVERVWWLDDVFDIHKPLEMDEEQTAKSWYQNGDALLLLTVNTNNAAVTIDQLRKIVQDRGAVAGSVADQAAAQNAAQNEVRKVMIYFVPIIIVILLLTSHSWLEPLLFLAAIGISIVLNTGTNILFGQVSFITQAVAPVLQLAVSMDYAVFLLSRFERYRAEGKNAAEAMKEAMSKSASTIVASALTTVFGFLALTLMNFGIGADLGIVLAKGIFFSMISVMVFLPVLTLMTRKWLDALKHRPYLPAFTWLGNRVVRFGIPIMLIVAVTVLPSYLAQQQNHFIYGTAKVDTQSAAANDRVLIEKSFGRASQMVLLVPKENWGKEKELLRELDALPHVISVVSYQYAVGAEIPTAYLTEQQLRTFFSDSYSRIMITADMEDESRDAFAFVRQVRKLAAHYFEDHHLVGTSVNIYDIKESVTADNLVVNTVAVIAIGMVLLIVFRSLTLPLILLFTIEAAIWINLSIPYFMGLTINYVGFLIISSVQLGATVDYGILFTQHYLDNRAICADKKEAARLCIRETAASILTPASILVLGGFCLYLISTNSIVKELGLVLGRGAALSAALVLFFLPNVLLLFDRIIEKTTLGLKFQRKVGEGRK